MNAIKESFDNLPTAVCIFDGRGLVRLMNRRMLAVTAALLGGGGTMTVTARSRFALTVRLPEKEVSL